MNVTPTKSSLVDACGLKINKDLLYSLEHKYDHLDLVKISVVWT